MTYPASYDNVIAVAATDWNDHKADFSTYGDWVDVAAPGVEILTTLLDRDDVYAICSGTSMACPHVAGLAALLFSINPRCSNDEVAEVITSTADPIDAVNPGYEGLLGSGRINAYKALSLFPVRNIDSGQYFMRIQDALDCPDTLDGHTIFVRNGAYFENLFVNKTVTLIGEDKSKTIIDGNEREKVINISANQVKITGFTIQNTGYWSCDVGLYINSDNNFIIGNVVGNNFANSMANGIQLERSSNNTISNNNIIDNNRGISLDWSCNNNTISGNTITTNINTDYSGIQLFCSSNNKIFRNAVKNGYYGIFLTDSNYNLIFDNIFDNINNAWDDGINMWNISKTPGTNIVGGSYLGGNYWDNYTGTDSNGDGLGDTPYYISGGSRQDTYPLVIICGDANNDGIINVVDVVYLINYLFIVPPGPEPKPIKCVGDCNGDGVVNVSDVICLINYLFLIPPGPPPGGCCK